MMFFWIISRRLALSLSVNKNFLGPFFSSFQLFTVLVDKPFGDKQSDRYLGCFIGVSSSWWNYWVCIHNSTSHVQIGQRRTLNSGRTDALHLVSKKAGFNSSLIAFKSM